MALFTGTANVPLIKSAFAGFVGLGEKAKADDFQMTIQGFNDLKFLVQTAQWPAIKREMVEITGPHGIQVKQQGKITNAHELPITFIETVQGHVLRDLRTWVKEKSYRQVTLKLLSEAQPNPNDYTSLLMDFCWFASEPVENSTEDNAPLKVSGTLYVNWVSYF